MPAPMVSSELGPRRACAAGAGLRERLLARVDSATAQALASADADLAAEIAAMEAAGGYAVPTEAELAGLAPDPYAGPPDGPDAWLADLPGPLLDEYLAAVAAPEGAEPLPAGKWRRRGGDGTGFAAGGICDDLPPGPVLAGLVAGVTEAGLGRCTDDELVGVLRAGRRLASWSASIELAAMAALMRHRLRQEEAGHTGVAEHADAEIAAALTLTGRAAGQLLDLAMALGRLPLTAAALAMGQLDIPRALAIAEELANLADEDVAAVEERILGRAPEQTTTQLRAAARRAVIAVDPAAARRRQERAQREARVERWTEPAGTTALAGRDLPPAEMLAADAHLSELARHLQAAGLAGTMDQLRAQAFLALLAGQPVTHLLPPDALQDDGRPASPDPRDHAGPGNDVDAHGTPGPDSAPGSGGRPGPGGPSDAVASVGADRTPGLGGMSGSQGDVGSHGARVQDGTAGSAGTPGADGDPGTGGTFGAGASGFGSGVGGRSGVAGIINLTVPLGSWLGWSDVPGEVAGFGPLSAADCRDLGGSLARHPQTRWCVTVTDARGHPVAHGCARPGHDPPAPSSQRGGPPQAGAGPPGQGPPGQGPLGQGPPIPGLPAISLRWLETGVCAHVRQSGAYRPPASLQHLVRVRQQRCAFPGCGRPARRCDLDHTTPFHLGGRTCECNLAPLCRKHHQAKQAQGWQLEQTAPGVMTWVTPAGRRYRTCPTSYPG